MRARLRRALPVLLLVSLTSPLVAGEIEEAEAAWTQAVRAEEAARRTLAAAEHRARAASQALAEAGSRDTGWARLREEVAEAEGEILELFQERARVDVLPEGPRARRRELRRQWDLLAPVREHLPPGAWRALDRELREGVRALEAATQARTARKAAVDEELRAARERLGVARRRLAAASQVELPRASWSAWWEAASEVTRARAAWSERRAAVEVAYRGRLEAAGRHAPVHVAGVEVRAAGRLGYQARWEGRDVSPEEHARLRAIWRDLHEIRAARREAAAGRLALAEAARPDVVAIQGAAADYGDALLAKEFAVLVTELAVTGAELALTGGGATLARKAAEAAEKGAALAARRARRKAAEAAGRLEGKALGDAIHHAADRAGALGLEEAVKARKLWRKRYLEEVAAQARSRATGSPEARRKAAEAARRQGERALAALDEKARRMEWTADAAEKLTRETRKLGEKLSEELATTAPDWRRAATSTALAKGTAGIGNAMAPPSGPAGSHVAGRILVSDLLESGMALGLESGGKGVTRALGELGTDASKWRKWKRGAAGFANGLRWKHLREVGANPANLLGMAGTLAKAGVAGYYQGEANAAQARFWLAFSALKAVEEVIARGVLADRELAAEEAAHVRAVAAAEARYLLGVMPRRKVVAVDQGLPGGASARVRVELSGAVAKAPELKLGEDTIPLTRDGDAWLGSLSLPETAGRKVLTLGLPRGGHALGPLDLDPTTPAYRNPRGYAWIGWERGEDTQHAVQVLGAASRPTTGTPDGPIPYEGNYLARFEGLPELAGPLQVTLTRGGGYAISAGRGRYGFQRKPNATWGFTATRPGAAGRRVVAQVHEAKYGGALRVAGGGVTFRIPARPPGTEATSVEVRLAGSGDGDLGGTWKSDEASGSVTWERVRAQVREVRAKILAHPRFSFRVSRLPAWRGIDRFHDAPVVAAAAPGQPLLVDLGRWYSPTDVDWFFRPESLAKARGNRSGLRFEILGSGLWGRHYLSVAPGSGLECPGARTMYAEGGAVAGLQVDLTMWHELRPGEHVLWLDGQRLPFQLAMPGR